MTAGHCRGCGALLKQSGTTWTPVESGALCRFGALTHVDIMATPADADLIQRGYTHLPHGTGFVA